MCDYRTLTGTPLNLQNMIVIRKVVMLRGRANKNEASDGK